MVASIPVLSLNQKKRGFALVLALALLSLVFLLVVSLVNLVSNDLSLVEARKEKILAQAHARMGMRIAIGEIQKHLGPDMRISGTADLLDERIESGSQYVTNTFQENREISDYIDLNEDKNYLDTQGAPNDTVPFGQRYWTGVWKHRGRDIGTVDKQGHKPLPKNLDTADSISKTAMRTYEYDPHPAIEIAWLVSGNEGFEKKLYFGSDANMMAEEFVEIPDGNVLQPDLKILGGGIYGKSNSQNAWEDYAFALLNSRQSPVLRGMSDQLPGYNHPVFGLPDPDTSDDVIWILKAPLLKNDFEYDPNKPDEWKKYLSAEPVKVRKTRIQNDQKDDPESKYGSYAFWVGDEGVKTKVNIYNPQKNASNLEVRKDNLLVATEPNLTYFSEEIGFGLNFAPEQENRRQNILSFDLLAESSEEKKEISAHYHSLTTDSLGLLTDNRVGGLKRDLSAAFAIEENWNRNKFKDRNWKTDFKDYVFKDLIHYIKSVPLEDGAKSNDWHTSATDETINEENAHLVGPRWTILGAFHNLYKLHDIVQEADPRTQVLENIVPDQFPRVSGDGFVSFNQINDDGGTINSPGGYSEVEGFVSGRAKASRYYNFFEGIETKPEPSNHPILPSLVEIKYSQHPVYANNRIGLALYPSVAFWNPYNFPLEINDLFVELPMTVELQAMDAELYDLYRKWWMNSFDANDYASEVEFLRQESPRSVDFPAPPLTPIDTDGDGINDFFPSAGGAGAKGTILPDGPSTIPYFTSSFPRLVDNELNDPLMSELNLGPGNSYDIDIRFHDVGDPAGKETFYDFALTQGINLEQVHFNPKKIVTNKKPLLLKIDSLKLEPGQKSNFVVKSTNIKLISSLAGKNYVEIDLHQGQEEVEKTCFVYDAVISNAETPYMFQHLCRNLQGVSSDNYEEYDIEGNRLDSLNPITSQGIKEGVTIYKNHPSDISNRILLFKLTDKFDLFPDEYDILNHQTKSYFSSLSSIGLDADLTNGNYLPGVGFRIRYKLPLKTENIVFEQYNLRALVSSEQHGSGKNWELELFDHRKSLGNYKEYDLENKGVASYTNLRGVVFPTNNVNRAESYGVRNPLVKYPNFYDSNYNRLTPAVSLLENKMTEPSPPLFIAGGVPKINFDSKIGFYHEEDLMLPANEVTPVDQALMFEIPDAPMLSMLQFRHANFNNYIHGPTYALGNSYASSQVSRYKPWGKVRNIEREAIFTSDWIQDGIDIGRAMAKEGSDDIWQAIWNSADGKFNCLDEYGLIRSKNNSKNHQNVTLDFSFYLNRALLDGYFLSGIGNGNDSALKDMPDLDPQLGHTRYKPFRNSRLLPYYRDGGWQGTEHAKGEDFKYQTQASDLLVDGAFNVNSTSVDAWASQLTALRGLPVPGLDGSDAVSENMTPVIRFTDYRAIDYKNNKSWNKLRTLSDEEIKSLAFKVVEQVKLRGPFLSFSDFVNRQLVGDDKNRASIPQEDWPEENRGSVLGLRGAIQSAIAEAGLNGEKNTINFVPQLPEQRLKNANLVQNPWASPSDFPFNFSEFGIPAFSKRNFNYWKPDVASNIVMDSAPLYYPPYPKYQKLPSEWKAEDPQSVINSVQKWGRGSFDYGGQTPGPGENPIFLSVPGKGDRQTIKYELRNHEDTFSFGEAPDNLLAIENAQTAANKPGWVMQADLLSPLVPVTTVRSDTFVIRVMGETLTSSQNQSKAWIELTVQRVPDYVKAELDPPYHRSHEPFEDRNFNGYYDVGYENWIDLNEDSFDVGNKPPTTAPNFSVGDTGYLDDGLRSDEPLNVDAAEESSADGISRMGINQRFGRKFKIVKFRWIREQDV